jgi:ketosteroid isomerase-like protein
MREETADVVRVPMAPTAHARRRFVERMALRFPRSRNLLAALIWRMPERIRRSFARRFVRNAWEAFNREDLDACFMLYREDCECVWDQQFPTVGLPDGVRGHDERLRVQERINAEWQSIEFVPTELIQFDDRIVSVGRMRFIGLSSSAPAETEWVVDVTMRAGRLAIERITLDHEKGLAAAGLSHVAG